jgi:hypothetical protein
MAVQAGIANLESSAVFGDAICNWKKRHKQQHTMINFNVDFKTAVTEQQ